MTEAPAPGDGVAPSPLDPSSEDAPIPRAAPSTGGRSVRRSPTAQIDRRTLWLSGGLLFGVLLAGIAIFALAYDPGPKGPAVTADGTGGIAEGEELTGGGAPNIVPDPNSGTAPADAGDRGGWAQLALLGLLVAAIVGIVLVVARGGGSGAQARRAAWKAAGESGRDGAVDP